MEAIVQGAANAKAVPQGMLAEDFFGERRLWLAVVMQAVEEWRNGTLRNRRHAQEFLFDNTRDFEAVCANAGLDASSLRSRLLKIGRKVNAQGPWTHSMAA
jgi:hypothetical protein